MSTIATASLGSWAQRGISSPTLMTWLNTGARVISLTVVLPLVLRQFEAADIALYHLFASLIALQLMCGSGFIPTFARFFSYVLAGARAEDLRALSTQRRDGPLALDAAVDARVLSGLVGTLDRLFAVLALGSIPLLAVVGTMLLRVPVAASSNGAAAWAAWMVIVAVTPLTLYANKYSALLQGANQVALEQRWSALFVIAGALSGALVLIAGGGLFALVLANQLWQLASFGRLAWLSRRVLRTLPFERKQASYSAQLFQAVWPASWRSFVGVAMSNGIMAAVGLGFAQRLESTRLAEFLLGQRIMAIIAEVSSAPFYSKIPRLNSERIRGNLHELVRLAGGGMRVAGLVFVVLFAITPLAANFFLPLIGSQVAFPSFEFWLLLGGATLLERWGAMHLQLYSTTNYIIWHWLNGLTGAVWIVLLVALAPLLGVLAYPLTMLIAYIAIYTQVAVRRSLRSLDLTLWQFERHNAAPVMLGFGCAALLAGLINPLLTR